MMKILLFAIFTVLCFTLAQTQNLDTLIDDVFTKPEGSTSATPNLQPNLGGNEGIPGVGDCVCVPYYLCNNGSINTNGEGIIDIRWAFFV